MLIIGSVALNYWFPEFKRQPKDIDIILKDGEEIDKTIYSPLKVEAFPNPVLLKWCNYEGYIKPNDLYTLKMSHAVGFEIFLAKHIFDIQFLKNKGCVLNIEMFYELYEYWNQIHGKNKRSDLEMTAELFFKNALKCDYDHDWLHTIINPNPTYNKVLKDGAEVEVSEDKFNNLSHEEKCDLVREEVMIMAFERWPKIDYRISYSKMLHKFLINHAPIWEGIFILENWIELHKPKFNFIEKINKHIENNQNITYRK